jgi:beta-glucosidase
MQSRRCFLATSGAAFLAGCSADSPRLPYQNERLAIEKRVEDLLGRMTAEEKSALIRSEAIARLGIPALHSVNANLSGVAIAATWNPELATRAGQTAAQDALAHGYAQVLGPTVQDYGEDPWLASRMTVATVSGIQGEGVIATVQRLPQGDAGVDERTLQERQLPAFEAAVEEAGVWSVMAASGDAHVVNDILRQQWGFKGFVVYPADSKNDRSDSPDDVRGILRAMFASGLFDRKSATAARPDPALAHLIDLQSIVLLRNDDALLPIRKDRVRTIAVIGDPSQRSIRDRAGSAFRVTYTTDGSHAIGLAQISDVAIVLAGRGSALTEAVTNANKQTVVVLQSGTSHVTNSLHRAAAVLQTWSEGPALTDILFGDANPSGKLPFAMEPLYPFGHGLSYTTFQYSDLRIYPQTPRYGQLIEVMFKVTNTGSRAGAEVVQIYIHDVKSSVERPFKELKGFKRVELGPGETKDVMIPLDQRALSFYDPLVKQWAAEPGEFDVIVGSSSRDNRLKGGFELFK